MTIAAVTRNTMAHLSGKIAATLLGVFTIALMTRYLGTEQFGWYTTAVAFLQIVGILIDFGLVLVTGQMLGQAAGDEKKIVHNLFAFRSLTAFVAYVGAAALVWVFPYPLAIKKAVVLTSLAFFLIAENQILTGIFQKHLKAQWVGIAELAQRAVLFAGVWMVIQQDAGFLPIMSAVVAGNVIQFCVMAVRAHKIVPLGLRFDKAVWKIIFKKSWPIAISIAFNLIYLRADVFLLSLIKSQHEVGLYGAAYRIMDVTTAVPIIFMGLLLPLLANAWSGKDKERFGKLIAQGFSIFSLVAIPMLFGGALLATPLMRLIAGEQFIASGPIVQILLLALMGGFIGALFGHAIVAIDHQRKTIWIYVVTAILTLLGYLYAIPRWGMFGAAWMTVFSELLAGGLLWHYIYKVSSVRVPLMPLVKAIVASFAMIAVLWPLQHLPVLFSITIGIAVYSLVIMLIKGVPYKTVKQLIS